MYSILIHTIFRVLNSAVFLGGGLWLFYTKMYKNITQSMQQHALYIDQLVKKHVQLTGKQQETIQAHDEQRVYIKQLTLAAQQWHITVQANKALQEKRIATYKQQQEARLEKQQLNYAQNNMVKSIIARTQKDIHKKLSEKYHDDKNAQMVLTSIINHLTK